MTDSKARKTPSKRALAMKAEARKVMREKIDFGQALTDIGKMENTLAELIKGEAEISNARIGAIRTFLDSKWKRIDRVLPPLKSLEVGGDPENTAPILLVTGIERSQDD